MKQESSQLDFSTPTTRRISESMSARRELSIAQEERLLGFSERRKFAETIGSLVDDEIRAAIVELLNAGLQKLEEAANKNPETRKEILVGAQAIFRAIEMYEVTLAAQAAQEEGARTRPLIAKNKAHASAAERAQAIATELWQADTAQEIRLGDMAERVYRALAAEGFTESLPGTAERIKEWIKPAAPDYARRPGRRRKTP